MSAEPEPAERPAPSWKRHFRFRWSLLIIFTMVVGGTIGIKVRHDRRARARKDFLAAVRSGDVETVMWCLDMAPSLVNRRHYRGTPLGVAAFEGYAEMAELLIDRGADVNGPNDFGAAPLHVMLDPLFASFSAPELVDMVQRLVDAGADVNARDNGGETPMHVLLSNPYPPSAHTIRASATRIAIAKLLLDHGADVDAKDNAGRTPRDLAERTGLLGLDELWDYAAKKRAGD